MKNFPRDIWSTSKRGPQKHHEEDDTKRRGIIIALPLREPYFRQGCVECIFCREKFPDYRRNKRLCNVQHLKHT
jgi:hypothetical protein